jgi:hypothetical protein
VKKCPLSKVNKMNGTSIIVWLLIVLAIFIGAPIATIWSLNTLFPVLAIPYTLETWVAAFVLFAGVSGIGLTNRK